MKNDPKPAKDVLDSSTKQKDSDKYRYLVVLWMRCIDYDGLVRMFRIKYESFSLENANRRMDGIVERKIKEALEENKRFSLLSQGSESTPADHQKYKILRTESRVVGDGTEFFHNHYSFQLIEIPFDTKVDTNLFTTAAESSYDKGPVENFFNNHYAELLVEKRADGSRLRIWAYLDAKDRLNIKGQVIGFAKIKGNPEGLHEYCCTTPYRNIPQLIGLFGGQPGEAIFPLLGKQWSGKKAKMLVDILIKNGFTLKVKPERIGDAGKYLF